MMLDSNELVTSEIAGAYFTLLKSNEVSALKTVNIDNSVPFGSNGPTVCGVHDPALGTNDGRDKCLTCHSTSNCNGHLGLIEFPLPLFHPLFKNELIKLLKIVCFQCCKLKASRKTLKQFLTKFQLLRRGLISRFTKYSLLTNSIKKARLEGFEQLFKKDRKHCLERLGRVPLRRMAKNSSTILHLYEETRESIFNLKTLKKCHNCKSPCPTNISNGADGATIEIIWGNSIDYISKHFNRIQQDKVFVFAHELAPFLERLFENQQKICKHLFPLTIKNGYLSFFMHSMCVTPNKFRIYLPVEGKNKVSLHSRTASLIAIIKSINELKNVMKNDKGLKNDSTVFSALSKCQIALNTLVDSTSASGITSGFNKDSFLATNRPGIKQLLEQKSGLLRSNMMGKRVNYSARTVIAPDCFLDTNEIGVPLHIAMSLDIPERVTRYNIKLMKRLVENGVHRYPGANYIRQGKALFFLGSLSESARKSKAKLLSLDSKKQTIVYRHLLQGDVVLMNRQPTLHMPGIMAHFVRVCLNQKTFRLNYVNCSAYNADFDGDEMNLHVPQDHLARAEAEAILNADAQHSGPRDGNPIRGLIQDHCQGGALLTHKDTFLTRMEFNDLAFEALQNAFHSNLVSIFPDSRVKDAAVDFSEFSGENISIDWSLWRNISRLYKRSEISSLLDNLDISVEIDLPAIIYPIQLWTGKQLITCVFRSLIDKIARYKLGPQLYKGINFIGNSKIPDNGSDTSIVMQDSELLLGVLDKSQFGATPFSLCHVIFQLLGPRACGAIQSSFARLFTTFLRSYGATCSIEDFILNPNPESERIELINSLVINGMYLQSLFASALKCKDNTPDSKFGDERGGVKNLIETPIRLGAFCDGKKRQMCEDDKISSTEKRRGVLSVSDDNSIVSSVRERCTPLPASLDQSIDSGKSEQLIMDNKLHALDKNSGFTKISKYYPSWLYNKDLDSKCSTSDQSNAEGVLKNFYPGVLIRKNSQFEQLLFSNKMKVAFDKFFTKYQAKLSSRIQDLMEDASLVLFPQNGFLRMIKTGAKGSMVNYIMICGMLNQQSLEGNRVPIMVSGRTLPSFAVFDFGTRAGGFITDRFITGLRPQEYFFHCMSGREGLIDTAVKTSKSGYLQRCIIKAMEAVIVHYDQTVRDSDGTILQFQYGEDGIDVCKSPFLLKPDHILKNLSVIPPAPTSLAAVDKYNCADKLKGLDLPSGLTNDEIDKFKRYISNFRIASGEPVGCIAGQSIGEPATQMTLNTFHLAGHSAANVTLGIPRLIEILIHAGSTSKPVMAIPVLGSTLEEISNNAKNAIRSLITLNLSDLINSIGVDSDLLLAKNSVNNYKSCELVWEYTISLQFENLIQFVRTGLDVSLNKILNSAKSALVTFTCRLQQLISATIDIHNKYQISGQIDTIQEFFKKHFVRESFGKIDKAAERYKRRIFSKGASSNEVKIKHAGYFHSLLFSNDLWLLEYKLRIPYSKCPYKLCLIDLLKNCINSQVVKSTHGIKNPIIVHKNTMTGSEYELQCSGDNLHLLIFLCKGNLDASHITSNDITAIYKTFGIEAAYCMIIRQLKTVFSSYGIVVDYRHLSLIADFMTNDGDIKGFSRYGIARHTSPLLQISFESGMKFLTRATERLAQDNLRTPSAALVTGARVFVGSSLCDLLYQLPIQKPKLRIPKPSDFKFLMHERQSNEIRSDGILSDDDF